jgi:hypothetical protein
MNEK